MTEFSGQLPVQISPNLHRELAFLAIEDNLEPEQLAAEMITAGIAIKSTGRVVRAGREERGERQEKGGRSRTGRGGRKDYHNIMDDRASFIEYVRNIDTGGKRKGHGHGRGRR